jgi:hypothetical protein
MTSQAGCVREIPEISGEFRDCPDDLDERNP